MPLAERVFAQVSYRVCVSKEALGCGETGVCPPTGSRHHMGALSLRLKLSTINLGIAKFHRDSVQIRLIHFRHEELSSDFRRRQREWRISPRRFAQDVNHGCA